MKAANLNLKFGVDIKSLSTGLQNANRKLSGMQKSMKMAAAAGAVVLAREIVNVTKQVMSFVMEGGRMADRLFDLRDMTGASTDKLQEYQYVAKVAGVNTEAYANNVQMLTQNLLKTDGQASRVTEIIKSLGVETRNANGQLRNQSQITDDVIGALSRMENTSERNAMAAKIFGTSWKDLAPILGLGADRIKELREEAHKNNLIVGEDGLTAANNARIAADKLSAQWEQAKLRITADLAPAIEEVLIPALEGAVTAFSDLISTTSKTFKVADQVGWWETSKMAMMAYFGSWKKMGKEAAELAKNMSAEQLEAMDGIFNQGGAGVEPEDLVPTKAVKGAIESVQDSIAELKKSIKTASEGELPALNTELERLTAELKRLEGLRLPDKIVPPELIENIGALKMDPTLPEVPKTLEKVAETASAVVDPAQNLRDGTHALTKQLAEMAQEGTMSFEELAAAGVGSARQLIRAFIAQSIAKAISSSIKMGPAGLLLAGVAAAGITKLFDKLLPKFAGGGDTPKGPMIVGERGPEIFMPGVRGHVMANHTLQSAMAGAGSGSMYVEVGGVMRASQFYLMQQRGRDSRSWMT